MDPYDTQLTYEQRAEARRRIRKQKLEAQSKNHVLINGTGTPEDEKDLSITNVLMNKLIDPPLQNGVLGNTDIVTVNGNGVLKHPSSSSEDLDNDVSPGALHSDSRGSIGSFSTLEGKSLSSVNEVWCDANNNSTSDISELSVSDSLLCEMGSDAVSLSNISATSPATNENIIKHPTVSHLADGTVKQRSKSESPSGSLRRSRKVSAPTIDASVSMEIPTVDDDDDDEVTEDFSLRRSKYTPIRRKRISLAGSCPSLEMRDLGPVPKLLGRLEESRETDSVKSSPEPLGKPTKQLHHKSPMSSTSHTQTKPIVHDKVVDEVDKPQGQPAAVKQKSDLVKTKPPLPITKSDSSGGVKQRRKSVKGLLFPKKMSRKSSSPPVEPIVEQPQPVQPVKDVTKPKVKKATRRAPLGSLISRLSPKRDIPSKEDGKHDGNKKEEAKHNQPRRISMTKTASQSRGSLVSKTSSSSSTRSTETFQGQKSSSFTVTKEPLKSSPSETSFASREASISIESLLSDGSTDILMADSNYDLFCSSSREDLLDSTSSSHHLYTTSEPLLSDVQQPEDTPLKLEDITLFTDEDDTGPSPAIWVSNPVNNQDKKLVAVKKDSPEVVVRKVDHNLYRAKSMEVLGSSKMVTDVEVLTSNTPASNLPSTISVSTENLSLSPSKRKSGIIVSTVKKCVSLDILSASKKQAPTTTITVSSKKTPTKAKPTPLNSSVQKTEEKKKDVQEKSTSLQVKDKGTSKSEGVAKSRLTPSSSPAITRQGSGRKLSGSSSPFMRTSSRSSTGRKKSTSVTPESKLNISARSNSPAKKTTITIKSSKTTPSKVTVVSNTATSTKSTDSSNHGNIQRVASPVKSSMRRPSMQRVSSGRKKSTEKATVKPPVTQSPSPQQRKIPFTSLFPGGDVRRISRVSSDEAPVNNAPKNDAVHFRSSSEVVTNTTPGHGTGLSDIVEDKMLITSSVETVASDRVTSSMSDTTALQKTVSTDTPVRRISSGPISNKTTSGSHAPTGSHTAVRKKSVTGQPRPTSAHHTTIGHHNTIGQHHSDSALKRPSSAATRRTSSSMKPSVSGTLPRQLTKTKSDSKIESSTLPRTRKVSDPAVSPETAPAKKFVRPHSAVSRGGSQTAARSSARRISLAPTSSAGKINRSSVTRRSKSIVTAPDVSYLKSNDDSKADEVDGAKLSTSAKPKAHDVSRKTSNALRSSLRRPSSANRPTDTNNIKDARQSPARSSRRSLHHSVAAKATSVAAVSHIVTPSRKASVAGRTGSGSNFLTPKLDASVSMSDLDSIKSADKLHSSTHRRFVRPKLRQKPSVNHLKQLMDRNDITSDISPDVNSKGNKVDPNSYSTYMGKKNLAASAVAGLASVENFAAVKLRKTNRNQEEVSSGSSAGVTFSAPTVSLIHIKGRRKIRSRLVNPTRASVNGEDVFILVTPTEIFQYIGAKANVLEKAKGAEIVQRIHQKKELGCSASTYHTIEEGKPSSKESLFWEILGGKKPNHHGNESGPTDELYEKTLPTSWVLYEFHGEKDHGKFVAIHEKQTGLPKKEVLKTDKIFLYDCGHEAYVWVGKQSTVENRKQALQKARKIFDDSCNMPDFAHMDSRSRPHSGRIRSKMTARKMSGAGFGSGGAFKVKHCERPSWALFVRLNEGSETVLFREKFADWPDESRIIKMKGHSITEKVVQQPALKPCDISKMLIPQPPFQGLVLEGDNVHRGAGKLDPHSSTGNKVSTISITKWLIRDTTRIIVPQSNHGIFHSGEGYVIRWQYRLCTLRKLEGLTSSDTPSRRTTSENDARYLESGGRDKMAYFYWQGDDSSIVGKGTTAYSTVELDEERASQVRVVQGREPAAFRNLWNGAMITLLQKSDINPLQGANDGTVRLYEVSGQCNTEAALLQLKKPDDKCSLSACLRSRCCFILHDVVGNRLFVWKGVKASNVLRQTAVTAAQKLNERLPNVQIIYIAESEEPAEFWFLLGGKWKYPSLLSDVRRHDFTPRLFELSSITQEFLATEVLHPCRSSDSMAFPFTQSDLYHASQPSIFLLDAHYEVFVWFGWWWKEEKGDENSVTATANSHTTGSRISRWLRDKQLALETAQQYAKGCTRFRTIQVYVVYAGTEHEDFIQHFPYWVVDKQVQQLNCKDTKPLPKKIYIDDELKKYTKMCYSLEELKERPLPNEVDPTKMETYLTEKDFLLAFKKTREEYYKLPLWKQTALKKEAGLF